MLPAHGDDDVLDQSHDEDEYNDSCSIAKKFNVAYNPEHTVLEVLHLSTPDVAEITSYLVSAPALGCLIDYLEDELIVDFED